jgi:PhnO protein
MEWMKNGKNEIPLSIRPIASPDTEAVTELIRQLGYDRSAEQIRDWIAGLDSAPGREAAFVACIGETVAGWIEISMQRRLQSPDFALIGGLIVAEQYRGHGIGRRLCDTAEQWAWAHGAARVRVTSRSTRADAHRFYVRDGFEAVKTSVVFEKARP